MAVTEEPVWPNPESQAEAAAGWELYDVRDASPPPPALPAVLAAVEARQARYAFIAEAMARYGGDSSLGRNTPLYISPARLGHLSARWGGGFAVAPPWCRRSSAAPDGERGVGRGEEEQGKQRSTPDGGDRAAMDPPPGQPRRRLIAFGSVAIEEARLRSALGASCC